MAALVVAQYRPIEQLVPAHWRQTDVVANGIRQHIYRTGGDKPPVVLVHGIQENAVSWLASARALQDDYDVIMVDLRGHGHSERLGANGFTQELITADIAGLIRALDLAPVSIVGFSLGGSTGIHVADEHPDLVRALVVAGWADQAAQPERPIEGDPSQSEGYRAWFQSWVAYVQALRTQSHAERMQAGLTQLHLGQPVPPEEQYVAAIDAYVHLDPQLVEDSMSLWAGVAERSVQMVAALERLTCPVLLMKSGLFPTGQPVTIEEVPSEQPNQRVVRFVNAGHVINRECFDDFIRLVREFLAEYAY